LLLAGTVVTSWRSVIQRTLEKKEMKKLTFLGLVVLILMTSLLGCNATRGAGKDIENTGKHIENIGK
jgi:predicted small secreted protein